MRHLVLGPAAALLLALTGTACGSGSTPAPGMPVSAPVTRHYSVSTKQNQRLALSLGFDVMDIAGGPSPNRTRVTVDALPRGVRALVWVGNLDNTDCTTPGYTDAQFRALVDALATDVKVYGYFLADEPHPLTCTHAVADIRARADYLHAHSRFQKTFIVIEDGYGPCRSSSGCEFRALRPDLTHVDLIGLDPYPCHYDSGGDAAHCNYGLIGERVDAATAAGIPLGRIVPVFQAFGQKGRIGGSIYYRLPTPDELRTILATWRRLVPDPALDFAYTFGVQCSATCPSPQALLNHPELQAVMRAYNR